MVQAMGITVRVCHMKLNSDAPMTKKELLNLMVFENSVETSQARWLLTRFFQDNICIPKGEHRHPCADVLHQWIEDVDKILMFTHADEEPTEANDFMLHHDFLIKPSEPVYEWLWETEDKFATTNKYYTEEQMLKMNGIWLKIEETKREKIE